MKVTLTPELQQAVEQIARQHGTTPEAIVLDAIRDKLKPDSSGLSRSCPAFLYLRPKTY